MSTIEPLDTASLDQVASVSGAVVVLEEHQLDGGLGEAIARHYAQTNPIPMGFVAMPNVFGESGPPETLMDHFGLGDETILRTALDTIKRKAQG